MGLVKKVDSNHQNRQSFSGDVDKLFKDFIPILEVMFGRLFPKESKEQIEKALEVLRLPSQEFAKKVDNLEPNYDKAKMVEIAEDFIRNIIPDSRSAESPLEYLRVRLFDIKPPIVEFVKASRYEVYLQCMRDIINTALVQWPEHISGYASAVNQAEADLKTWGQSIASGMGKTVKYLNKDRVRFTAKLASRCIEEYGKMSGVYERLIAIIAGFVSINSNRIPNYQNFRRRSLAINLRTIRNHNWNDITDDFDILIRNSIAHHSYVIYPKEKIVRFSDPIGNQDESISYKDLFGKTRDLCSLILALSQFLALVDEALLRNFIS